eukprot:964772-Heterocapsa_arctica.AAC.1
MGRVGGGVKAGSHGPSLIGGSVSFEQEVMNFVLQRVIVSAAIVESVLSFAGSVVIGFKQFSLGGQSDVF